MMAHRRRKKNIIPLNVVRKRGEKHRVSKEFVNITVYSTSPQLQHVSSVPANLESGEGCTQELIPGYLTDQPEDQITLSHEADSYQSQHSKRKLKQNEKWRESSYSAFKALIEEESMKMDETCSNCGAPANVRCRHCGPCVYFCSDCGVRFHSRWNYHHYPERWKV